MNEYRYADPDHRYTDPETGVLRNKLNIRDRDALMFAEAAVTAKRMQELWISPIRITSSSALLTTHLHLFQDIYEWAGEQRAVEINKGGKQFFPTSHFDSALRYTDSLLAEYRHIDTEDRAALASKLAEILDTINHLHLFREGNGRTQREVIRSLATENGWKLDLNPPDDAGIYKRYMDGTINGDTEALAGLLYDILYKDGTTGSNRLQSGTSQ